MRKRGMDLEEIARLTTEAFNSARSHILVEAMTLRHCREPEDQYIARLKKEEEQLQEAYRLLDGILRAEILYRQKNKPPLRDLLIYRTEGSGARPKGGHVTFCRRRDLDSTHPPGTRGWFGSEEECVEAMWGDYDEERAYSKS